MYVWSVAHGSGIRVNAESAPNQSADMSVGGLTVESIEQLGLFDLIVKSTDNNKTVFSFRFATEALTAYYEITVETSSNRLLQAKITAHVESGDNLITTISTMTYDYTPVTVVLPANREEFITL